MTHTEVVVVGGGPAGLCAALAAAQYECQVLLIDRQTVLGGQLIKQTHRFFGSRAQRAGTRGFEIGRALADEVQSLPNVQVWLDTTVVSYYTEDGTLLVDREGTELEVVKPERLIVATGAAERSLAFPNNDLPGVFGAGAVQTLMNVYGIVPGKRAVMIGAGNIGLIIGYQLLQAGVDVAAVLEAAPSVGGYWVHGAKLARAGVPILNSHSIIGAYGTDHVIGVRATKLDSAWRPIPGSEFDIECDVVCLAVGLSPLTELLALAECGMTYVPELGGHVPVHDEHRQTTVPGIYVAGDVAGVEEASSAMVGGRLAGLAAAHSLKDIPDYNQLHAESSSELSALREGPTGEKIRSGLRRLQRVAAVHELVGGGVSE